MALRLLKGVGGLGLFLAQWWRPDKTELCRWALLLVGACRGRDQYSLLGLVAALAWSSFLPCLSGWDQAGQGVLFPASPCLSSVWVFVFFVTFTATQLQAWQLWCLLLSLLLCEGEFSPYIALLATLLLLALGGQRQSRCLHYLRFGPSVSFLSFPRVSRG